MKQQKTTPANPLRDGPQIKTAPRPLDGTKYESITSNLGLVNYPWYGVSIEDIIAQIKSNESQS